MANALQHPTTSITEAREAHRYWSQRAAALPWHRRAARREARQMTATARARLITAHLHRLGLRRLEPLVAPFFNSGGRSTGAHLRSLAFVSMRRTAIGRRILIAAAAATAGAVALLCVAGVLVTQLL